MNKKLSITALLCFFVLSFSLEVNAQWARIFGGTLSEEAYSIQQTSDGGYIVAGWTLSFAWPRDIWILKLDTNGDVEWQKTYGGNRLDNAYSIQQTSDGGYIVVVETDSFSDLSTIDDIWVLKLSSSGEIEWQKAYGGDRGDKAAYSIQETSDGGYIVAGYTDSFSVEDFNYDIWVLKLFSNGDIEWQKTYGESGHDSAYSIQQTSDNGYIVLVAGSSEVLKLSSDGDIEWQKTYEGAWARSIQQTIEGGYIVAGGTSSFGAGSSDIWVLKLSSSGEIEWQNAYGGSDYDNANSIQQTSDGGYIVAGRTDSFGDEDGNFWVLKLSSSGEIEWQKEYGGNDDNDSEDCARSIQQTDDGGYIVAGYTESFGTSQTSFLILKLNSQGEIDPSCDFIESTDATITPTSISPEDTNIEPQDTYVVPLETSVSPQDTDANVILPCEVPKYTLTISHTAGGFTEPFPGTYTYNSGTRITIHAIPQGGGYIFCGWTGVLPSGITYVNPIEITMNSDKSIRATFKYGTCDGGDEEDGASEKKGPCFIATGVYGSPLHPYVRILRDFRDKYLMPSRPGRMLINFYYKYSPIVANLISKHKVLKIAVRINLLPLVVFSYSMVHFGSTITAFMLAFVFALPIFFILSYRRK